MRASIPFRALGTLLLAALLAGCGSGSPTAPGDGPGTTLQVPAGPQVLRVLAQSPGGSPCRLTTIPIVYTAVTVTRAGSEWIARAASAAAGDVELRIRVVSSNPAATLVAGTIKGSAVHMPGITLTAGLEGLTGDGRMTFGNDGSSTLNGVIFPLTPGGSTAAFDGIGTGSISVIDGSGNSCSQTGFSWMLFPQP